MSIYGSIFGSLISLGSTIYGGLKASEAMKDAQGMVKKQAKDNQNWYDRRINEDATQRADAQRIMAMTDERIKNRNKAVAGAQAVMGGTDESVAAAKAQNNEALAEATSQIAAAGDRRKDQIESQYLQNKSDLEKRLEEYEVQRANNITQAASGAASVGSKMGGMF